ncbi:T9SS type A sorting domain-containing protein [Pseudobacter ginsenosidimutans]|uniref:Putative secreted protein (Por secretion system target) n=1 Tax=Pseudobacter ginsenosidimutans TaxID=661488 RepID=A0A4Q7MZC5_9BACT|nr:T9SS type A sorting domain-containing protein [Pseudobacter ginsenosidimutans]QEC42963.1 T9SS type A sorting domain-containing protein [Pseudobacter ginsenosidimutans]RZS74313.1 putative secreted protein (Por secretion system target) [Pseudobacter ginsenosidimutans]
MNKTLPQLTIKIVVLTFLTGFNANAQLIPNPDFESSTSCPSQHSRFINNVSNWLVSLGGFAGSPDYFKTCGFQMTDKIVAQSGSGFAGVYMELNNTFTDYKEYFTSQLSAPLQAGVTYTFTFYTAHIHGASPASFPTPGNFIYEDLPDAEQGFIGLVFSTVAPAAANTVGNTSPRYNSIKNDFGSGRSLIPKSNTAVYGSASRNAWVMVTLQYTAVGGEQFMTVGQFRPGGTSLAAGHGAYYVFDNFSATSTLPVTLENFTATKKGNAVLLNWATVSEQNNLGFEVERSASGKEWSFVTSVKSKALNGNSHAKLEYNYTDHSPFNGINFYRLKQTDLDGKSEYSNVKQLTIDAEKLSFYPNPVSSELFVSGLKQLTGLQLFNVHGQFIRAVPVRSASSMKIDMSGLPAGTYILKTIGNGGESETYKINKK